MFRLSLALVCGIGIGVALMDTLHRPEKPRAVAQQVAVLSEPIMKPDFTLQSCSTIYKCGPVRRYYIGMVRK